MLITHLFLASLSSTATSTRISGLHLQHGAEQVIGGSCEETDLSVRVQTIQVGTLSR